jgi:hypothetical protein
MFDWIVGVVLSYESITTYERTGSVGAIALVSRCLRRQVWDPLAWWLGYGSEKVALMERTPAEMPGA